MLELIYTMAGGVAAILSFPQLMQMVRQKNSDEFSLLMWVVSLIYQFIALAYSIQVHASAYTIVSIVWIVFYAIMVILIVRYRPAKRPVKRMAKRRTRTA